jgi:YHS domain-containing protein
MKLLILILIVYLVYRTVKSWIVRNVQPLGGGSPHNPEIDDVMVKDPVCGIYFPRREGVNHQENGQTYVFCSMACRDRFLKERK